MKDRITDYSILMTVYKKEKPENLEKSLSSLENQTLLPNEIVIVEDGQLGKALDNVIKRHKLLLRNIYKIIILKENHGRGYASRIGIKYISNNWFARMDSDDISCKDRFRLQIEAVNRYRKKYPRLAVVGGQVSEFVDVEYSIVGYRKVPLEPKKIKKFAAYRSPINNPTVMINKSALLDIGSYSNLNVLEDYDLWIRFMSANYVLVNIPNVLVNMRVNNNMYRRRGGVKYLYTYIKQKNIWKCQGIGSNWTVILSSLAMFGSSLFPVSIRKALYQKILHKRR